MMTARKRGPAPLPPERKRRNQISALLTDAELELVRAAADGTPLNIFIRETALAAARRRIRR